MKTNYQKINSFEVAVVGMIVVGFVMVGILLFSTLTPRAQNKMAESSNVFDIHKQLAATADALQFIVDAPNEFYDKFYVAFTQVAVMPEESISYPLHIVQEFTGNFSVAIDNLTVQVADGYAAQNHIQPDTGEGMFLDQPKLAIAGQVLGAVIDLSDKFSTAVLFPNSPSAFEPNNVSENYTQSYEYSPPDFTLIESSLSKFFK